MDEEYKKQIITQMNKFRQLKDMGEYGDDINDREWKDDIFTRLDSQQYIYRCYQEPYSL